MKLWRYILLGMAITAASCASPDRRSGPAAPEDELRQIVLREGDVDIVAIQYEEKSGTAVVQLRTRDAAGKESLSYRWYHRKDDRWVPAPYAGAKRPDVP